MFLFSSQTSQCIYNNLDQFVILFLSGQFYVHIDHLDLT